MKCCRSRTRGIPKESRQCLCDTETPRQFRGVDPLLTCLSLRPKSKTSSMIVNLGILSYSLPILPFS